METPKPEIYCIVCRSRLCYFYGWFCGNQFPWLGSVPQQEPGRKREPWPGEA
jgi:hypothetical protein